jgi:hypothetical protein
LRDAIEVDLLRPKEEKGHREDRVAHRVPPSFGCLALECLPMPSVEEQVRRHRPRMACGEDVLDVDPQLRGERPDRHALLLGNPLR